MVEAAEDRGNRSALWRDRLAHTRTALANERTLLAYIRTALALVATGIILERFVEVRFAGVLGWIIALLGVSVLFVGLNRFARVKRVMDEQRSNHARGVGD